MPLYQIRHSVYGSKHGSVRINSFPSVSPRLANPRAHYLSATNPFVIRWSQGNRNKADLWLEVSANFGIELAFRAVNRIKYRLGATAQSGIIRPALTEKEVKDMLQHIKTLIRDEEGASAVEYGLLVALIAAVIIVAVTTLGTNLSSKFTDVAGKIK